MLAATHNGEWIPKVFVGVYLASAAFDFIFLALRNPKNDGGRRAPLSAMKRTTDHKQNDLECMMPFHGTLSTYLPEL